MYRFLYLLLLVILLIGCSDKSDRDIIEAEDKAIRKILQQATRKTPKTPQEAYQVLVNTEVFADIAVSYHGETPPEIFAFRMILEEPGASGIFKSLLKEGYLAGQLYGLCGLYLTDREKFNSVVDSYRVNKQTVMTFHGCIISDMTVSEIVDFPLPNGIRLKAGQSLEQWYEENPQGGRLDIVGGGYPHRFAYSKLNIVIKYRRDL